MTVLIRNGATDINVINVLYENAFDQGAVTYSSAASGFAGTNAQDDATWNAWKPSALASFVSVSFASGKMCNTLGIAAHDIGTVGAFVSLYYSDDGVNWTAIILNYQPTDNDDIIVYFEDTTARHWRVNLSSGMPAIGVIKLGASLKFPCVPLSGHKALHHSRKVEMLSNTSTGGNFLGNRPISMGAQTSVNVGMIDRDWAENDLAEFEKHFNNGGAFFYCGAPNDIPKDMGYCRREGGMSEMSITWVEGDIMADVSFEMAAYVAI